MRWNYAEKHTNRGGLQVSAVRYCFNGELLVSQIPGIIHASLTCRQQTRNETMTVSMMQTMPKDGKETDIGNCGNQRARGQP